MFKFPGLGFLKLLGHHIQTVDNNFSKMPKHLKKKNIQSMLHTTA